MFNLAYKEFVQIRRHLLQIVVFLILTIVVFARTTPSFALGYLYVLPVVFGMTLPQVIFEQEERGNTFAFLRALPIHPREIVAAKYLVAGLLNLAFIAVTCSRIPWGLPRKDQALPVSQSWRWRRSPCRA